MADHDHNDCPLLFDDPGDIDRLRELLARLNYTDQGVSELLGIQGARSMSELDVPLLLHGTDGGSPLETLVRLFLIGVSVESRAARQATEPMELDQWVKAGLLQIQDDSVVGAMRLLPFQGLVLAFDLPQRIETEQGIDYVMGVGSSTITLANLTVRRPSRLTLDLGTGCGFQALLAAPHSEQVMAVDTNPRAVRIAAFNARLNGLSNVASLEGDLFAPVEGHAFDLVVSNPPFVISPETRFIYRDSGMHGDQITHTIVRRVPDYLCEGGFCQILCNWTQTTGEDWRQRLAGWFEGTGCDAWVIRSDTLAASAYASKWIRHTERDAPQQFRDRFDQWMDYYRQEQIETISGGLITMRRRSEAVPWFRADDAPEKMLGPAGDGVLLGFELRDFLEATRDDQVLLSRRLRISPDVRLQQQLQPCPKGWLIDDAELQLRLCRGLAYSGNVDPYVAHLLARCDGQRVLGEVLREVAGFLEREPADVLPAMLDIVRRLVEQGFLLPEDCDHTT